MTRTNAFAAGAAALLIAATSGVALAQTAGTTDGDAKATQPSVPNSSMQTKGAVGGGESPAGGSGAASGSMGSTPGAAKPATGAASSLKFDAALAAMVAGAGYLLL